MIDCKPIVALCKDKPEYKISVESYDDFINLHQFEGEERNLIEIASADQAHNLIMVIRAAMMLNGWDK
jgi:hypothetical protein